MKEKKFKLWKHLLEDCWNLEEDIKFEVMFENNFFYFHGHGHKVCNILPEKILSFLTTDQQELILDIGSELRFKKLEKSKFELVVKYYEDGKNYEFVIDNSFFSNFISLAIEVEDFFAHKKNNFETYNRLLEIQKILNKK